MAFTTGTATDYADLLDKLRLYLVAQGWTQLAWTAGTISGGGHLAIRGPGAGAGQEVYCELWTEANVGAGHYGWRMRGATGWDAGNAEGSQPGQQGEPSYFNLWESGIDYWFYVNDRRFIVVAKIGTSYYSMYMGFFLPWATPAGYPFPLYVAGTYFELNDHTLGNSAHRFFADPGLNGTVDGAAFVRKPSGVWIPFGNHQPSGANDSNHSYAKSGDYGCVHPYGTGDEDDVVQSNQYQYSGTALLDNMVRTRQNETAIWPISLIAVVSREAYGVLDGAYCIPGDGLITEQAFTADARNFRVFQNINRNSGNDFVAIEEV